MSKKQQAARQRPEDAGSCYEGCCGCGLIYYETQPAGGEVTPLGLAPLVLRYELRQYPNTPPMDAMLVGLIEETETGLRWISVATIADILARLAAPAPASREEP